MTGFEAVNRVIVPASCAASTRAHLRQAGSQHAEGLVVWSGTQVGDIFRVQTVTAPEQRAIRTSSGICVVVDSDALHRLNVWLHQNKQVLIAQVHSHPTEAFHSSMDDEYAVVAARGSLSLVVPDFAAGTFSIANCAVFRLRADGRWREVRTREACALITITPPGA